MDTILNKCTLIKEKSKTQHLANGIGLSNFKSQIVPKLLKFHSLLTLDPLATSLSTKRHSISWGKLLRLQIKNFRLFNQLENINNSMFSEWVFLKKRAWLLINQKIHRALLLKMHQLRFLHLRLKIIAYNLWKMFHLKIVLWVHGKSSREKFELTLAISLIMMKQNSQDQYILLEIIWEIQPAIQNFLFSKKTIYLMFPKW